MIGILSHGNDCVESGFSTDKTPVPSTFVKIPGNEEMIKWIIKEGGEELQECLVDDDDNDKENLENQQNDRLDKEKEEKRKKKKEEKQANKDSKRKKKDDNRVRKKFPSLKDTQKKIIERERKMREEKEQENEGQENEEQENEEQDNEDNEHSLWIKPITELLINHGYLIEDADVIRKFLALCKKFKKTQKVIGDQFIKFTEGNTEGKVDLALVNQFGTSLNEANNAKNSEQNKNDNEEENEEPELGKPGPSQTNLMAIRFGRLVDSTMAYKFENGKYECNCCPYSSTRHGDIKKHINYNHAGT